MPDQPDPGRDPAKDWSAEKARLEVRKLRMDLRGYSEQLALQQKKLAADSRDWAYKLLVAGATTLLGVITFTAGQVYQRQSDARKRAIDAITERDSRARQYMAQLNDPNLAVRMAAVSALGAYLGPAGENQPSSWHDSAWEREVRKADLEAQMMLRTDAIGAIALRLVAETELHALEQDSRVLTTAGLSALPAVANANRIATDEFERSAGDYIANFVHGTNIDDCEESSAARTARNELDQLVTRTRMPFETVFETGIDASGNPVPIGIERSGFKPSEVLKNFASGGVLSLECHYQVQSRKYAPHGSNHTFSEETLVRNAQSLAVSSLTLVRIVRQLPPERPRLSLNAVLIVNGVRGRISFRNADLRSAYISGTPDTFDCQACDLSNADLRDLTLNSGSDFTGATLSSTHFGAPVATGVLIEPKWRHSALQHLPGCSAIGFHLDQTPQCKN